MARMKMGWTLHVLSCLCLGTLLGGSLGSRAEAADSDEPPSSWTDPRVLAELAKSCAFNPDKLKKSARAKWTGDLSDGGTSVMSCDAGYEQSCVPDPCNDDMNNKCRPRCQKSCTSCGTACVTTCETCKSGCTDEACRQSCARGCAECRQECVRQRDRCATGTCSAQYKECDRKRKAAWKRNNCPKVCSDFKECKERCEKKPAKPGSPPDCEDECKPSSGKCNLVFCDEGEWG
jgi:hypothetical protein